MAEREHDDQVAVDAAEAQAELVDGWRAGHDDPPATEPGGLDELPPPATPAGARADALAAWRLSPHFLASEFRQHDGQSSTPAQQLVWLTRLAVKYLEPLRAEFGPVTVVSGYRSRIYNAGVGGAPHSFHVCENGRTGAAADVKCARGRPADWYRFLDSLGPGGLGLYPSWVHVDNRIGRARW